MSLFGMKLLGSPPKKKTKTKKSDLVRKSKSVGQRETAGPSPAIQKTSSTREALLKKRSGRLLSALSDVPKFERVIQSEDDVIPIQEEDRSDLIALAIDSKEKKYIIVISSKRIAIPVDKKAERVRGYARKAGWSLSGIYYLEKSLIQEIYNQNKESSDVADQSELIADFISIAKYALDNEMSDIHIEVSETGALVRGRRNSLLENYRNMGVEYATSLCRVVYGVLTSSDGKDLSFLPRHQQSGVVEVDVPGHGLTRFRLNTFPTAPSGVDMVLRVLRTGDGKKTDLSSLGYNKNLVKSLSFASARPVGALIIAGTTGSGKSTTLKTILEEKVEKFTTPNGLTIKIITVEDPPEFNIAGVSQGNVSTSNASDANSNDKKPFNDAIKAAMRCDPDILMAGEVRDEDSADLLMHITLSGHQVMTTIHASSAISIIARLRNNGIPNDVLGNSDFISGLVYQRLVPKICNECSIPLSQFSKSEVTESEKELLNRIDQVIPDTERSNIKFRDLRGCGHCKSGVVGQTVVAEVILPDHTMLEYFLKGEDYKAWHHHKAMGGKTVIDHANEKIINGICDPRDVEQKIGLITMDLVNDDAKFEFEEMETHGYAMETKNVSYHAYDELNDIRKKKVDRAIKYLMVRHENGDELVSSIANKDLLATCIHNDVFDAEELYEIFFDRGVDFSKRSFNEHKDELKGVLR